MGAQILANPRGTATPHRPGVLVVDDDGQVRAELSDLLRLQGYVVTEATDGAHALEVLRRDPGVDVVLLDLWMPHMDGWAFRAEQRADDAVRDVPVIVLTADSRSQARAIHANAFISKPFSTALLLTTVRRILEERAAKARCARERVSEAVSLIAAAVGHEVANPLMALIAGLERARGDAMATGASPQAGGPGVEQMLDLCWRIASCLGTLRDLPCPPWTREEAIDMGRLVRASIARVNSKEVTIAFTGDPAAWVRGDPLVVLYLCGALVRNAVEALPAPRASREPNALGNHPDVDVRLQRSSTDEVVLDVSDRGAAIPQEDLAQLFVFNQPGRERGWGAGLRLWLVRPLVQALGGTIEISNEAEGWVRCRVRLPATDVGPSDV